MILGGEFRYRVSPGGICHSKGKIGKKIHNQYVVMNKPLHDGGRPLLINTQRFLQCDLGEEGTKSQRY